MTHPLWNDEMDVQERTGRQRPGMPTDQKLTCKPVNLCEIIVFNQTKWRQYICQPNLFIESDKMSMLLLFW